MRNSEVAAAFFGCLCVFRGVMVDAIPVARGRRDISTAAPVKCGRLTCDPFSQYCDLNVRRCESCSLKCGGNIDKYMREECIADCPAFMKKKDSEKESDKSGVSRQDDISQLRQALESLIKGYKVQNNGDVAHAEPDYMKYGQFFLLVIITIGVVSMVYKMYCGRCPLRIGKGMKNSDSVIHQVSEEGASSPNPAEGDATTPLTTKNAQPANPRDSGPQGVLPANGHRQQEPNTADNDANVIPKTADSDVNVDPKIVNLPPENRSTDGSAKMDPTANSLERFNSERFNPTEIEAGIKGDELGKNLNHQNSNKLKPDSTFRKTSAEKMDSRAVDVMTCV